MSTGVARLVHHDATVRRIATTVKQFFDRKESFRISHGSTNSTRPVHNDKVIDISELSNIIHIDTVGRSVLVQPNVPMDKLIEATLRHNLIPPVVMEFPGITVGGGYARSAGESSSFKYGYFDHTVDWVEIVLGNGRIVEASREKNPELFKGAAGALGSLGIITLLELRLIPAKRFVRMTYQRTSSIQETIDTIEMETHNHENDYVDGVLFSQSHGVVITGKLTDTLPSSVRTAQTFSRPWDPWYYLHVLEKTHHPESQPITIYTSIAEYLFRWDRGGFWVGNEGFEYFGFVPFNRLTRWFLDDFMHT